MRRRISLYIEGQLVEMDEQSFVLFNYAAEDLSNPTVVKNSYSQTVKIPGTAANNRIFGHIFRSDRMQASEGFNPLKKAEFAIYDEKNALLQSGYARLTSWENKAGVITYSLSLFGGLGSFFYNISHDTNDEQWNIGDLLLAHKNKLESQFSLTASKVKAAWQALGTTTGDWSWFNFAPAYNGLPDDFESKKAYFNHASGNDPYHNLTKFWNEDGVMYGPKNGNTAGVIVEMGEEHTEWEVQDFRCYLQRPIVKIKALFEAICNKTYNGGFDVVLDSSLDDIEAYTDGWLTLPMLNWKDNDVTNMSWATFFDGTMTPTEFLVSFAKMYGLVLFVDDKTITIMHRSVFYMWQLGAEIDLSKRIDTSSISVVPTSVESKYYQFAYNDSVGEQVAKYNEAYSTPYGAIKVNSGYEFETSVKEMFDKLTIKGAADVVESSPFFFEREYRQTGQAVRQIFKFAIYEECKTTLYATIDGEVKETTVTAPVYDNSQTTDVMYSLAAQYRDAFPKLQLHDDDNGSADGSGAILFYHGQQSPSRSTTHYWHLSDDNEDMLDLCGGKPCWNISQEGEGIVGVTSIPQFIRGKVATGQYQAPSVDFGRSAENYVGLPGSSVDNTIYVNFWKSYIMDRFDVDSKVMTCKVDLSGMQVGQSMFREFYHYDGALWALNKIKNHSLTTYDLTECEFVKVKDPLNYTE